MFWNRHRQLVQRAEQAEADRAELHRQLTEERQRYTELQDLYEQLSEANDQLLDCFNTVTMQYKGITQSIQARHN